MTLRRPIILRPPARETVGLPQPGQAAEAAPAGQSAPAPSATESENQRLREEAAAMRQSLEEWTKAEAEWNQQRSLFQIVTDNVSDLIVLLDAQGVRTWTNPAYGHLLGYTAEELVGTHALTEVHQDDLARVTEVLNTTLRDGSTQEVEFRAQKHDGDVLFLRSELIAMVDVEGKVDSVIWLSTDTTENSKLTEALALASTQATAAALVEGMARDFDQILTNVVGNLTIAKNLNGPHNAIAVRLNEMERSLQRARDLIEQMFSITPEQSQPKVRVAFEPAVQEAVSTVLRGTLIRAEYLFPRNLPDIEVDQEAFSHAIRNIVTNSVQAMDKGVVRFSAESIPHSQFSYRPGPAAEGGRLRLPAYPGPGAWHFREGAAARFRALLHDAQRVAGPRADHGAVVHTADGRDDPDRFDAGRGHDGFALSAGSLGRADGNGFGQHAATAASAGPTTPASVRASTPPMPVKPAQKKRILLMDDEQMILDIVSRMLGHLGYDVTTCTDGSQAIAAFAKSKSHSETVRHRDDGFGHSQRRGRAGRGAYDQEDRSECAGDRQQWAPRASGHARPREVRFQRGAGKALQAGEAAAGDRSGAQCAAGAGGLGRQFTMTFSHTERDPMWPQSGVPGHESPV